MNLLSRVIHAAALDGREYERLEADRRAGLQALAIVPGWTGSVFLLTWIWMFGAMVVAAKHVLDYTTWWRTALVCAIALSIPLSLLISVAILLGS